jgi:hypothetical protein
MFASADATYSWVIFDVHKEGIAAWITEARLETKEKLCPTLAHDLAVSTVALTGS